MKEEECQYLINNSSCEKTNLKSLSWKDKPNRQTITMILCRTHTKLVRINIRKMPQYYELIKQIKIVRVVL